MAVFLVELEPRRSLVVMQRVDAQIENHHPSERASIAFVACIARRARSGGARFSATGTSRLSAISAGSAPSKPRRSRLYVVQVFARHLLQLGERIAGAKEMDGVDEQATIGFARAAQDTQRAGDVRDVDPRHRLQIGAQP